MTNRYPHDDDWGDYEHERRRAKALDRKHDELLAAVPPALRTQVEADLINVRAMNLAFDAIFGKPWSDDSDTCQRCGAKHRGTGCNCGDL